MAGPKKGKASKSKGSSKSRDGKAKEPKKLKSSQDEVTSQLPAEERVQAVRPFWEAQPHEERIKLLSIDVEELRVRARELTVKQQQQAALEEAEAKALNPFVATDANLEPTPEQILETGLRRLKDKGTWKIWRWPFSGQEFLDADSFRQFVEAEHIDADLRALLTEPQGKPVETPAQQQLRLRMTELLHKVHASTRALHEDALIGITLRHRRGQRATPDQIHTAVRDTNIDLITQMLDALEHEHKYLYHAVLLPINSFVCELLPESMRDSSRTDLHFEDFEKLPPDDVAHISEWLTEKVDGFGAKDFAKKEEEKGIGDVDLFTLSEDGKSLIANVRWLEHLQVRCLGEDGHPCKVMDGRVKDGKDPSSSGLVLEWVYGIIVSTAEKARDGAKRALGMRVPTAQQAHDQLITALQDHQSWVLRGRQSKDLLSEMLVSRKEAAELALEFDIRAVPKQPGSHDKDPEGYELPDHVIISMLKHEVLLTRAKLHALNYDHHVGERKLRTLMSQLRQGEPKFERLKRELEEVKNLQRGLEGTFRTTAEMERRRAQQADAAIEEQLEVQTAFREHGSRLQGIYDSRQRMELEMARREQEMKQLQGWKSTVQSLIERIEEEFTVSSTPPSGGVVEEQGQAASQLIAAGDPKGEAGTKQLGADHDTSPKRQDGSNDAPAYQLAQHAQQGASQPTALSKLRAHFHKDVRCQLYTPDDEKTFYDWIQRTLLSVAKQLEDGRAALQHLEMQLVNVACDDPGAVIGAQLALPILQERLDNKALEFAADRAAEAELALLRLEEQNAEKVRLEREKKLRAKAKAKERAWAEKERLAAEKVAREQLALEKAKLQRMHEELAMAEAAFQQAQQEEAERLAVDEAARQRKREEAKWAAMEKAAMEKEALQRKHEEAERLAMEKAALQRAQREEAERVAMEKAALQCKREEAERLAVETAALQRKHQEAERLAAEQAALQRKHEEAERLAAEQAALQRAQQEEEEDRQRRLDDEEAQRRAEMALTEVSRPELLSEETSYWRRFTEQEEAALALQEAALHGNAGQVAHLRKKLLRFWRGGGSSRSKPYADDFTCWWQTLNAVDKMNFLLTYAPPMPDFAGQPHTERRGEVLNMTGMAAIAPDLNIRDLTACNGQKLLDILEERAAQAEAWFAPDRQAAFVDKLDVRDADVIKPMYGHLISLRPGCVVLTSGRPDGKPEAYQVKDGHEVQRLIDRSHGRLMWWDHHFYTRTRQALVLGTLLALAMSYLAGVWGIAMVRDPAGGLMPADPVMSCESVPQPSSEQASVPSAGSTGSPAAATASDSDSANASGKQKACGNCRVVAQKGVKLRFCSGCEAVCYCNRECQLAHWRTHRRQCARQDRR